MLFSVPDLKQITNIPHEESYWACINHLTDEEYNAIFESLSISSHVAQLQSRPQK